MQRFAQFFCDVDSQTDIPNPVALVKVSPKNINNCNITVDGRNPAPADTVGSSFQCCTFVNVYVCIYMYIYIYIYTRN